MKAICADQADMGRSARILRLNMKFDPIRRFLDQILRWSVIGKKALGREHFALCSVVQRTILSREGKGAK
jgi:hypothetical protein